jgi:hypothetical protein
MNLRLHLWGLEFRLVRITSVFSPFINVASAYEGVKVLLSVFIRTLIATAYLTVYQPCIYFQSPLWLVGWMLGTIIIVLIMAVTGLKFSIQQLLCHTDTRLSNLIM